MTTPFIQGKYVLNNFSSKAYMLPYTFTISLKKNHELYLIVSIFCVFINVTEPFTFLFIFPFWRALYHIRFLKARTDLTKLSQNSKG